MIFRLLTLLVCLGCWNKVGAQSAPIVFSPLGTFEYSRFYSGYSALFDRQGEPILYSAAKELGLVIFDISDPSKPMPMDTLSGPSLHQLDVTNLFQQKQLLYLSLGGIQGISQKAGLAILDVQNPTKPLVLDVWDSPDYQQGSAIVQVEGDYAYLGAMEDGLIVLNVADPANIQFVSRFKPDPSWPGAVITPPNGRGLAVRDNIAYLCYDAGGLRLIDLNDKQHPFELSRYANPALLAKAAPAYNNIRLVGPYAFLAVDYCGLEVVDIRQAATPKGIAWLNPWDCKGASWFGSDGHLNELALAAGDSLLFAAGGDSEVLVFDVSDPTQTKAIGGIAMPGDSAATWGVDVWGDLVVLSFIDNSALPFFQPFYADFGGLQLFRWQKTTGLSADIALGNIRVYPNPTSGLVRLSVPHNMESQQVEILNVYGKILQKHAFSGQETGLDLSGLSPGSYFFRIHAGSRFYVGKIFKM